MPRKRIASKKNRRVKRKARSYRRKYSTITRRRFRKLRRRRGFRSKSKFRRSAYSVGSKVGLKYKMILSPVQFMTFSYWDIENLLATAFKSTNDMKPSIWASGTVEDFKYFETQFAADLHMLYGCTFNPLSTKVFLPTTQDQNDYYKKLRSYIQFVTFNPPLHEKICGSRFNEYVNRYQLFKFVGLKVKWIPAKSTFNSTSSGFHTVGQTDNFKGEVLSSFAPHQNVTNQTGMAVPEVPFVMNLYPTQDQVQLSEPEKKAVGFFYGASSTVPQMSIHYDHISLNNPPQYRLWVDFERGFEMSMQVPMCPIEATAAEITSNTNVPLSYAQNMKKYMPESRFKYRSMFYDGKLAVNTNYIKNYSLLRPFKFFVRPYFVKAGIQETGNLTAELSGYEKSNPIAETLQIPTPDDFISRKMKMPYIQCPMFYPRNYAFCQDNSFKTAETAPERLFNCCKLSVNLNDKNFFNPPLFNFTFSRDDLDIEEYDAPVGIREQRNAHAVQQPFMLNRFVGDKRLENLGKFQLTFYTRFRKIRPNVAPTEINYSLPNGTNPDLSFPRETDGYPF